MRERHRRDRFWINSYNSNNVSNVQETFDTSHATLVSIRGWNQGPAADALYVNGLYGVPDMYPKLVEREQAWAPFGVGGVWHWPLATALHIGPTQIYAATYNSGTGVATELFNGLNGTVAGVLAVSNPNIGQRNGAYWYGIGSGKSMSVANFIYMRAAVKNTLPCALNFAAFFTVSNEIFLDSNVGSSEFIQISYDLANQRITIGDTLGRSASSPIGSFPANQWCSVSLQWVPGTWAFYNNGVSVGTAPFPVGAYAATNGSASFNRLAAANTLCWPSFMYNHSNLGQQFAQRHYEGSFFNFKAISILYSTGSIAPFVAKTITINRMVDPGMPDEIAIVPTNATGIWYVDVQILNEV